MKFSGFHNTSQWKRVIPSLQLIAKCLKQTSSKPTCTVNLPEILTSVTKAGKKSLGEAGLVLVCVTALEISKNHPAVLEEMLPLASCAHPAAAYFHSSTGVVWKWSLTAKKKKERLSFWFRFTFYGPATFERLTVYNKWNNSWFRH